MPTTPNRIREPWLLSPRCFARPLVPGDRIGDGRGAMVLVYEVRRFASTTTTIISGRRVRLFAVLHAGSGSVMVAHFSGMRQREWRLTPKQIAAYKAALPDTLPTQERP